MSETHDVVGRLWREARRAGKNLVELEHGDRVVPARLLARLVEALGRAQGLSGRLERVARAVGDSARDDVSAAVSGRLAFRHLSEDVRHAMSGFLLPLGELGQKTHALETEPVGDEQYDTLCGAGSTRRTERGLPYQLTCDACHNKLPEVFGEEYRLMDSGSRTPPSAEILLYRIWRHTTAPLGSFVPPHYDDDRLNNFRLLGLLEPLSVTAPFGRPSFRVSPRGLRLLKRRGRIPEQTCERCGMPPPLPGHDALCFCDNLVEPSAP